MSRTSRPKGFDLIVIGSGMGGLTVASLASQLLNWRVLVLERHWQLGGFTHAFTRGRWRWDVGLHYVGGLAAGSHTRQLFDLVTGGLRWQPLPQRLDVLHLPRERIELDGCEEAQAQTLIERFPAEAAPIRAYFADLALLRRKLGPALYGASAPPWLAWPIQLWSRGARRLAAQTTQAYLDTRFSDPALKTVVACRWGDYGLAPHESAFGIHATVLGSYAGGAGRPEGGAPAIAAAVSRVVLAHGGELRTQAEVERIVVERGRAVGVRLTDASGGSHTIHAPRIVSAAGAFTTYTRLLEASSIPPKALQQVRALEPRSSAAVLYLGLKADPARIGLRGENHWIVGADALACSGASIDDVAAGHAPLIFVSTAGGEAQGLESRLPTAQLMVPMQMEGFKRWARTPWQQRGSEYEGFKQFMADGLLCQVEQHLPGLRSLVASQELSTPLTVNSMTGHPNGAIYGLACTPLRMLEPIGALTPVPGLVLAGSDVCTPGIQGALMGGVFAAAALIGARGMPMIARAAARRARCSDRSAPVAGQPQFEPAEERS
jgi:all-trans-retinol 13,14-reductase